MIFCAKSNKKKKKMTKFVLKSNDSYFYDEKVAFITTKSGGLFL